MIKSTIDVKEKLIVALDTSDLEEAKRLIDELREETGMFKVGLELFTHAGNAIFDLIQKEQIKVFFDGKFMDIPNTVAHASRNIARHGVSMFNVHASGGYEMMKAAAEATSDQAKKEEIEKPILIAVTVLTSLSDAELEKELAVRVPVKEHVKNLSKLAKQAGLDGVVASAQEASIIRTELKEDFVIVTPGIRPEWARSNDQTRIVTPKQAIENGADYLVVGRPITKSENRKDAARKIVEEMETALS